MSAMTLDASEVAALLREFGQRTALRGGNPFRAKSYARAADSLLALTRPLDAIIREDRLREIPGAGDAIAGIIARLHRTGTHPALEDMRKEMPDSGIMAAATATIRSSSVALMVQNRVPVEPPVSP